MNRIDPSLITENVLPRAARTRPVIRRADPVRSIGIHWRARAARNETNNKVGNRNIVPLVISCPRRKSRPLCRR